MSDLAHGQNGYQSVLDLWTLPEEAVVPVQEEEEHERQPPTGRELRSARPDQLTPHLPGVLIEPAPSGPTYRSLMNLEAEYKAHCRARPASQAASSSIQDEQKKG